MRDIDGDSKHVNNSPGDIVGLEILPRDSVSTSPSIVESKIGRSSLKHAHHV